MLGLLNHKYIGIEVTSFLDEKIKYNYVQLNVAKKDFSILIK